MGPEPETGWLLGIDWRKQQITTFDPHTQSLRIIPCKVVDRAANVRSEDSRLRAKQFPIIDRTSDA